MTDKKTYRIDENALRDKLTNYTVSFNADSFNFLENEVAQVKTSNPIELPDTKKLVQFIGIPVAIAILGCGVYFGVNYIKNLPASTPKKDTVTVAKPAEPKIEEKKVVPSPATTPSVVINTEEKKKDTVVAVVPQPVQPVKIKEKKNTVTQIVPVKKDSGQTSIAAKTTIDSAEKKNKVDTASVNKNKNVAPKKKKKRKNSLDATEDIRQSQPSSSEDEVIVPDPTPKQE